MSWQDILKNEMDVKTLEEIATELEKAVKAHASQAKRIRDELARKFAPHLDMLAKNASASTPQPPTVRPKTDGDRSFIARAKRNLEEERRNR